MSNDPQMKNACSWLRPYGHGHDANQPPLHTCIFWARARWKPPLQALEYSVKCAYFGMPGNKCRHMYGGSVLQWWRDIQCITIISRVLELATVLSKFKKHQKWFPWTCTQESQLAHSMWPLIQHWSVLAIACSFRDAFDIFTMRPPVLLLQHMPFAFKCNVCRAFDLELFVWFVGCPETSMQIIYTPSPKQNIVK